MTLLRRKEPPAARKQRFNAVEIPVKAPRPEAAAKVKDTGAKAKAGLQSSAAPKSKQAPQQQPQPRADPVDRNDPQYRMHAPIEDPALAQQVMGRVLDSTISLSQRELWALSPEVRKAIRTLTTGKRVPVNLQDGPVDAETSEEPGPEEGDEASDAAGEVFHTHCAPFPALAAAEHMPI